MTMQMTTLSYDELFETLLGVSVCGIVLSALWIVWILVSIEANKAAMYSLHVESSLEMMETNATSTSTSTSTSDSDRDSGLHVESPNTPSSPKSLRASTSPTSASGTKKQARRVHLSFKLMQLASVTALMLLTYLLLVVSNAPMWVSAVGAICVFVMFLRYQIGDELRRQRIDRVALMISLFLFMAALMSLCTYSYKSLANGEIYEGPARIVGYDQTSYSNADHDPSTRADLEVQWGKDWGCPLSGGKVCQAQVHGAMCTANLDAGDVEAEEGGRTRRNHRQRQLQRQQHRQLQRRELQRRELQNNSGNGGSTGKQQADPSTTASPETEDAATEGLEEENKELEEENEKLQKEVEEMELEEEETEKVAEEEVEEVEEEEVEDAAIYNEDIETVEEEEMEVEEVYTDAYVEVEEEEIETEEKYETDPEVVTEDEEEVQALEDEETEVNEIYDEYVGEYEDNAETYEEEADAAEEEEFAIEEEEEVTEEEYDEAIEETAEGGLTQEEEEAVAEQAEEEMEDAAEEEMEEENLEDDWYWEEVSYEYDDDWYENEYWEYDWDSAWGEYACEDLFAEDTGGLDYDTNVAAGADDYPFINIYGSCKTCEAYVLDYFAEEAFESVQEYKQQAILYLTAAITGFIFSFATFIKYKVSPVKENEMELLGSGGGVMA